MTKQKKTISLYKIHLFGSNNMKKLLLVLSSLMAFSLNATVLTQGQTMPIIGLQDQHDILQQVNSNTQRILFSRDMAGSKIIQASIEALGGKLPENVIYIADISGMPSIISKLFALPKMKKYSFPVALDKEGEITSTLPSKEDNASLINLDNMKITEVQFFDTAKSLEKALKP